MHTWTCSRRMARLADTEGTGAEGGEGAGFPGRCLRAHQRASLRSTDRAAPLGPIIRYSSRMVIIVSTPNSVAGERWI